MKRAIGLLAVTCLVLSACGDDDAGVFDTSEPTEATADSSTTSSTIADSTTTAPPSSTTTAAPASTTTAAPATTASTTTTTALFGGAVPSGSGCTPSGDVLPDGDWFGFLEGVDMSGFPTRITFDLACHFEGAHADTAAAADGRTDPLEFYPYVRNRNPKVFDIAVDGGATTDAFMGGQQFDLWYGNLPPEDGCSKDSGHSACALWITVGGGVVTMAYGVLPEWSGDGRD